MQPLVLSDPHRGLAPHAYVIMIRTTECLSCRHIGTLSETYARTHLKAHMGRGKYITNLRRLDGRPWYNLPIMIEHAPTQTVPFCDRCPDPQSLVATLPYPPLETKPEIVGFTSPAPSTPTTTQARSKKTSTTDDLLKGLDL